MSFDRLKMAFARFTILISIFLYIQGIHGQQSGLLSAPSAEKNSLNLVPQNNQGSTQENFKQNQNSIQANQAINFNAQVPLNFQSPQPTVSTQSTLSFPQPQRATQPMTLQLAPIPNFQQAFNVQNPSQFESLFSQQRQQQSNDLKTQNLPQPQTSNNVYRTPVAQQIPAAKQPIQQQSVKVGDYGTQQPYSIPNPVVSQIPVQPLTDVPNTSFITSMPSASASSIPSPCQRTNNINNLRPNYIPLTTNAYSIIEATPISSPYSSLPAMAVLSTPTPIPLATRSVMSYANGVVENESPLRIPNNFLPEDVAKDLNRDPLTSLALSLLQSPKKSLKSAILDSPANSYLSSYLNQGSKSSSLKSLLPLILEILSEDRGSCGCRASCQSHEQNKRSEEFSEPQIYDGYSKKRDYSLREEMFNKDGCEDNPRMAREHNKSRKLKNSIPVDSCEDDGTEYGDCSEEDGD